MARLGHYWIPISAFVLKLIDGIQRLMYWPACIVILLAAKNISYDNRRIGGRTECSSILYYS
jgi:hypothetical protein